MIKFFKRYKSTLLIVLIIITILILGITIYSIITNTKTKIQQINNNIYSLQYDNSWKKIIEEENEIKLLHKKSKSELNITIKNLENEHQYKSLEEITDSLLYNIQEHNKNYSLIHKEKSKIPKSDIDLYRILLESDSSQVMIDLYKQGNRIIVFTYESTFRYFDILLDNVKRIINSFTLNEQTFDVISNINLYTTDIHYTEQEDVTKLLNNVEEYEIAASNYCVNYSIPSNFKLIDYNTRQGSFKFENITDGTNIDLRTSILQCNLYEYLDREETPNIYSKYNLNLYNEVKEEINILNNEPLSYIYRNSYLYKNKITENITIVFELNKNHIFIVELSSRGIGIPKELITMIKVNTTENIASSIKIQKEDIFLTGNLKRFVDSTYKQTEEIKLKLPDNYKELDKEENLYRKRNYVCGYDKVKDIYEYEITYETVKSNIDTQLEIINKDKENLKEYGKYTELSKGKERTIHDKKFMEYERGYTNLSNELDENGNRYKYYTKEKIFFYKLDDNNYLVIKIRANDNREITDELINQLTNFDIIIN